MPHWRDKKHEPKQLRQANMAAAELLKFCAFLFRRTQTDKSAENTYATPANYEV